MIEIYWLKLLVILISIYLMMIIFDTVTGVMLARQKWTISSKINITWSTKKITIIMFILLLLSLTSCITQFTNLENNFVWLIPHFFLLLFMFWEFISICENMAWIFTNKNSWKIFMILNYLSTKIFNLTLDKLKEKTENKIENKINNF